MENLYKTLFPALHFNGAFLTPDLQMAFIIPILEESESLRKTPSSGNIFVQIHNGFTYIANGEIYFEGDLYKVSITVRLADPYTMEMNNWSRLFTGKFKFPKDFTIPTVFKGVDGESYCVGVMDICDRIAPV